MTLPSLSVQSSRTLRLGTTGTLILGAAGSAAAANLSNGTIVYTENPGISAAQPAKKGEHNLVYFDITDDGRNDFLIDSSSVLKGTLSTDPDALALMRLNDGDPIAFGSLIGPETTFYPITEESGRTTTSGVMLPGGASYYGFSFIDGSTTNYGWMHLSYVSKTVNVLGWAYDTTGAPVIAGSITPIPEVSTTALSTGAFALLAGSAAAWRRRRTKIPAAA